jgi:hypothetical protein
MSNRSRFPIDIFDKPKLKVIITKFAHKTALSTNNTYNDYIKIEIIFDPRTSYKIISPNIKSC